MLHTLTELFNFAPLAATAQTYQYLHLLLDTFESNKLVDGHNSRNAAIDTVIQFLQSKKVSVEPVVTEQAPTA